MTMTVVKSMMKPTEAVEKAATTAWSRTISATGSAPNRLTPARSRVECPTSQPQCWFGGEGSEVKNRGAALESAGRRV